MKLTRCYVKNFGKLQDFTYNFNEGLNVIQEQNGWGKSTFANFIKFMFYGLKSSTKRNLDENEMEKYRPWNGEKYGGSIEFKLQGKLYKIERFVVGKKETFKLYDLETNLESDDYSERIGEEIFSVDKDGFERSLYIPQQHIKTDIDNDSLSAKLSNVLQSGNDIDNYDTAKTRLEEKMKEYKSFRGNGGKIQSTENQIIELKKNFRECEEQEQVMKIIEDKIHNQEEERRELVENIEIMRKEYEKVSKLEAQKAKRAHYDNLLKNINEKKARISELEGFFRNGIPDENTVNEMSRLSIQYEDIKGDVENNCITSGDRDSFQRLDEIFENNMLTDDMLDECQKYIIEEQKITEKIKLYEISDADKQRYNVLKEVFHDDINIDNQVEETIKLYDEQKELQGRENEFRRQLDARTNEKEALSEVRKEMPQKRAIIVVCAFLIVSLVIMIFNFKIGLLGLGLDLVTGVYIFYSNSKKRQQTKAGEKQKKRVELEIKELEKIIIDVGNKNKEISARLEKFISKYMDNSGNILADLMEIRERYNEYLRLENTINFNSNYVSELNQKLHEQREKQSAVLKGLCDVFSGDATDIYNEVKVKQKEYTSLKGKIEKDKANRLTLKEDEEKLNTFLSGYFQNIDGHYNERINDIKKKVNEITILQEDVGKAQSEIREFENENDIQGVNTEETQYTRGTNK